MQRVGREAHTAERLAPRLVLALEVAFQHDATAARDDDAVDVLLSGSDELIEPCR